MNYILREVRVDFQCTQSKPDIYVECSNMSWFDAGALANIAKSALKEAQKTIDKALDIKEDSENSVLVNTPIDTNPDDFFGTWGITQSGNVSDPKKEVLDETVKQNKMGTSIWGSFTGKVYSY